MEKINIQSFSTAEALAEKFFWQMMLTDTWDHLFAGDPDGESFKMSLRPREALFHPSQRWTSKAVDRLIGNDVERVFAGDRSRVMVGMCKEEVFGPDLWYPNSVRLELFLSGDLAKKYGQLVSSPILKVWTKK